MIDTFFNWAEKRPYGLLALILLVQANVILPAIVLLIMFSQLPTDPGMVLMGISVASSMCLVVVNLSLQPPRLIAKLFLGNLIYHLVLAIVILLAFF